MLCTCLNIDVMRVVIHSFQFDIRKAGKLIAFYEIESNYARNAMMNSDLVLRFFTMFLFYKISIPNKLFKLVDKLTYVTFNCYFASFNLFYNSHSGLSTIDHEPY